MYMTVSLKKVMIKVLLEMAKQNSACIRLGHINILLHLPLAVCYLCVIIVKEQG